eukprot:8568206-Alexandrium_andersonii.AAC.1
MSHLRAASGAGGHSTGARRRESDQLRGDGRAGPQAGQGRRGGELLGLEHPGRRHAILQVRAGGRQGRRQRPAALRRDLGQLGRGAPQHRDRPGR